MLMGSLGKSLRCVVSFPSWGRLAEHRTGAAGCAQPRESSGSAWDQTARVRKRVERKEGWEKKEEGVSEREGVSQPKALTGLNTVLGQQIIGA